MNVQELKNTPRYSYVDGVSTCPLAEAIAEKISVRECLAKDEVVLDLYGYVSWVFDAQMARGVFRTTYRRTGYRMRANEIPTEAEVEAALGVLEERADAELAR